MTYTSRIPEIVAELPPRCNLVLSKTAKLVVELAQADVPRDTGALHDAIHVEPEGEFTYLVKAGDNKAWYGHIVEHGGAYTSAHPFLVPATEKARLRIDEFGAEAFREL